MHASHKEEKMLNGTFRTNEKLVKNTKLKG